MAAPQPPSPPIGVGVSAAGALLADGALPAPVPSSGNGARPARRRARLGLETCGLLSLCLGKSAVYSVLSLVNSLTVGSKLNEQTTTINGAVTPDRPWLDVAYKLADDFFLIVPVVMAIYLLASVRRPGPSVWRAIGLDGLRVRRDVLVGVGATAAVGIPGLGCYLLGRQLGLNTTINTAGSGASLAAIAFYVVAAAANAGLEEIVMIGYLLTRWRQAGWNAWAAIVTSALIRGSYHLYQGFAGFIGNVVMGLAFGWYWQRTRRLWPLIVAHTLLDVFSFVGYALLKNVWTWL
ncbi:CPBP family intramembrane glutamic endopeptidase [Propionibacterium freudenreichii]|uniref:CPBP family intramembrane glutamic endopeptidase n=1 Tax=Propionibacterium freudenreichii TaxID=1744 RepID=UPI0005A5C9D0|nr:CPBP family intramembrane glutamic endopeptidase [Propionibacterium freudenreichii]CEI50336.1 Hypothetical membrane protein [Propionibacterium freudenreichii]SBN59252.1 CAAX amino terminal protease family protein [Propionibacterium freudenreichii]SBN94705.1 CAAX amino terminal protease family protein [Propionibacterium freudenreichii]SBT28459.1 CAAX amino terminal protease family protein [Propionibacterium freudenreichii]SCC96289.1 CAAX amino terminal protease family protein [Propionibacter